MPPQARVGNSLPVTDARTTSLGEDPTRDEGEAKEGPGPGDGPAASSYVVSLALQRGPYPYEQRIAVAAAVDAETEADPEIVPDEWSKAIGRAFREGAEVQIVRLAIPENEVAAAFIAGAGHRSFPLADHYNVRLALCRCGDLDEAPFVAAWLDEQTAAGYGCGLDAALGKLPMPYRRRVARADGEVREVIVSAPLAVIRRAFDPPAVPAVLCEVLTSADPRL